ncbi:hypothetical protein GGH91_001835 [Coemansia sp. RSA 2671]|uniref:Uncharacterized protein n=2 Tax=Coemansia TaxID=4863 RepID=A0A9W8L2Y6_9FUNG|nr:hypothetical protein LPJ60_003878 [Coemansia sp. RSA 2675]KAJ2347412.1 hypothetical protein GGH91_001835 [Coemansia sp. RSA 2671]KAJ2684035.1 hypothetical protein IWW39_005156 [Coemansia spiralis]
MSQNSQSNAVAPVGGKQASHIPIGSAGGMRSNDKQAAPIPIGFAGGVRSSAYTGKEAGSSRRQEPEPRLPPGSADSVGSHMAMQGIEAPPNSLVAAPLHIGPGSLGGSRFAGGGCNAPPNTPAQVSMLAQTMANAGVGSGPVQEFGTGNLPTNSFIEKKICGMGSVREDAEAETMFQDMSIEFSPGSSSRSSFRQDSPRMPGEESEYMFPMDR